MKKDEVQKYDATREVVKDKEAVVKSESEQYSEHKSDRYNGEVSTVKNMSSKRMSANKEASAKVEAESGAYTSVEDE